MINWKQHQSEIFDVVPLREGNRAKVAASDRSPRMFAGHCQECLTAQRHGTAQRNLVGCYDSNVVTV